MYMFICKECGNIQKYDESKGTIELKCERCASKLGWESSFPPLTALNLKNSAQLLLEQSKKQDREILQATELLITKTGKSNINETFIDKWINTYENWLEKYPDNDDNIWIERDDKFEDIICNELGVELGLNLFSALKFDKNYFRKPYVIMVASMIEQLFNDYFNELVRMNLPEYGSKVFLRKYNTAGIQTTIDIAECFLEESLAEKMNRYSDAFSDRWTSLRKLRNDIIHSNSTYISKNKISRINKLAEESFLVFSNLKSEMYKNNKK